MPVQHTVPGALKMHQSAAYRHTFKQETLQGIGNIFHGGNDSTQAWQPIPQAAAPKLSVQYVLFNHRIHHDADVGLDAILV